MVEAKVRRSLRQFLLLCVVALSIWLFGSFSEIQGHGSHTSYSYSYSSSPIGDAGDSGGRSTPSSSSPVSYGSKPRTNDDDGYAADCVRRDLEQLSQSSEDAFSVLELVAEENAIHHLASEFDNAIWLSSLPPLADLDQSKVIPGVKHLSKAKLRWLYRTPQLFDVLSILDYDASEAEYEKISSDENVDWIVVMLSLAKRIYLRSRQKGAEELVSAVGERVARSDRSGLAKMKVRVSQLEKSNVVRVDLLYMERKVLNHYRDQRPKKHGGSCPTMSLFYQAVAIGRGVSPASAEAAEGEERGKEFVSHQWLCKLEKAKGVRACGNDLGSRQRCVRGEGEDFNNVTLTHSWIGADIMAGLGANAATSRYLLRSFLKLPTRGDCFLWNMCLVKNLKPAWCEFRDQKLGHSLIERGAAKGDPNVVGKHVNHACVKFEFDTKYMENSACCIDMMLLRLYGCEREKNYVHQLTAGQALDETSSLDCRERHIDQYLFRPVKYRANFLESVQEAFIFGEGLEPRRMTKQELILELKVLGVQVTNRMNKELLIEKLETERVKVSDMSEIQVVNELKRYHVSTKGQLNELKYRLQNIRNNNYLGYKLNRGGKISRGTILPDLDPQKMSKEMLQKELQIAYGLNTQGTKRELIQKIEDARVRFPKKFEKYMDELNDLASLSTKVSKEATIQKPLSEMSKQELMRELEKLNIKPRGNKYDMLEQLMKEKQKRLEISSSDFNSPTSRARGAGGDNMDKYSGSGSRFGSETDAGTQDVILLSEMSKSELESNLEVLGVEVEKGSKSKSFLAKLLLNKSLEQLKLPRKAKADSLTKTELQKILLKFGFSIEGSKELLQSRIVHYILVQILQ